MRLYGKRFLRNAMESKVRERIESRDTIIWEIYPDERYCIVKVAGSSALVRAWFPRNTDKIPPWLKVGMTARIAHVGGDRSRIEVIGHGLVLPASLSGVTLPPIPVGDDGSLTGMQVNQTTSPGQSVAITEGTYRINGVLYDFNPDTSMGDGGEWHVGDGGLMSGGYLVMPVDLVGGGEGNYLFRYDAFVIGTDGIVHYIKGAEWQWTYLSGSGPVKPAIPGDHVLISDYILRWSGQTEVYNRDIGREYEEPTPSEIRRTDDHPELWTVEWETRGYESPWCTDEAPMGLQMTLSLFDQYGNSVLWINTLIDLEFNYLPDIPEDNISGYIDFGAYGTMGALSPSVKPLTISLGPSNSISFKVWRSHFYYEQSDPELAGYPGFWQGSDVDGSPTITVDLVNAGVTGVRYSFQVFFIGPDGYPMFGKLDPRDPRNGGTAYRVSGVISLGGNPLAAVLVVLTGVRTIDNASVNFMASTDNNGIFAFNSVLAGNYVVTPQMAGHTFTPASRSVTVSGSVSGLDFVAT
jgi:hypothetical protein